jgi:membrane protein
MPKEVPNILEPGGNEVATAAGSARKYRKPLLSFCWRDLGSMFTASFSEWSRHKAPRLGASLVFYTLPSIAPLLLILVSVVGLVLDHQTAQRAIISQVQAVVGSQGGSGRSSLTGRSPEHQSRRHRRSFRSTNSLIWRFWSID